jgi:long-subunit acyl-CoA synthetase (AMP-forming)
MAGFDGDALRRAAEQVQPNSLILVPELLKALTTGVAAMPDSLCFVAVGGARCDPALIETARRQGIPAYEGYGLTECGSVVSLNRPGADQPGTVGRALPHVLLEVDGTREVRISSAAFLGYLNDPAAVQSPRFATGDLGHLDHDGYLRLSGRRKNLLVTAFGRNVAPEWIEAALTAQTEIVQAVTLGEARPWLAAVLVPRPGTRATALSHAVERVNAGLPDYARIRAWISAEPFTAGNGLATGNSRPLRAAIAARHADAVNMLYADKEMLDVVL